MSIATLPFSVQLFMLLFTVMALIPVGAVVVEIARSKQSTSSST